MNERHFGVLLSAAEGDTIQEYAEEEGCSPAWVARLRCEVCRELGARNIVHAVALAYQRKILSS